MIIFWLILYVSIVKCDETVTTTITHYTTPHQTINKDATFIISKAVRLIEDLNSFVLVTPIPKNDKSETFKDLIDAARQYVELLTQFKAELLSFKVLVSDFPNTVEDVCKKSKNSMDNTNLYEFNSSKVFEVPLGMIERHLDSLNISAAVYKKIKEDWSKVNLLWKPSEMGPPSKDTELKKKINIEKDKIIGYEQSFYDQKLELDKAESTYKQLEGQLKDAKELISEIHQDISSIKSKNRELRNTNDKVITSELEELQNVGNIEDGMSEVNKFMVQCQEKYQLDLKFYQDQRSLIHKEMLNQKSTKEKKTNFYVLVDQSSSMKPLWNYVKSAYSTFIQSCRNINNRGEIYVASFDTKVKIYVEGEDIDEADEDFESKFNQMINYIMMWGNTDFGAPLLQLEKWMRKKSPEQENAVVFFITDGEAPTSKAVNIATKLHQKWKSSLKFFSIGLDVKNDGLTAIKEISKAANGATYIAGDDDKHILDFVIAISQNDDIERKLSPIFVELGTAAFNLINQLSESLKRVDDAITHTHLAYTKQLALIRKRPEEIGNAIQPLIDELTKNIKMRKSVVKNNIKEEIEKNTLREENLKVQLNETYKLQNIIETKISEQITIQELKKGNLGMIMESLNTSRELLSKYQRTVDEQPLELKGWEPLTMEDISKIYSNVAYLTNEKVDVDVAITGIIAIIEQTMDGLVFFRNNLLKVNTGSVKFSEIDSVLLSLLKSASPEVQKECGDLTNGMQLQAFFRWIFNLKNDTIEWEVLNEIENVIGISTVLKMEGDHLAVLKQKFEEPVKRADSMLKNYKERKSNPNCISVDDIDSQLKEINELKMTAVRSKDFDSVKSFQEIIKGSKEELKALKDELKEEAIDCNKIPYDDTITELMGYIDNNTTRMNSHIFTAENLIKRMKNTIITGTDGVRKKNIQKQLEDTISHTTKTVISGVTIFIGGGEKVPRIENKKDEL